MVVAAFYSSTVKCVNSTEFIRLCHLKENKFQCEQQNKIEGNSCPTSWDGVYCWENTPALGYAYIPFPNCNGKNNTSSSYSFF